MTRPGWPLPGSWAWWGRTDGCMAGRTPVVLVLMALGAGWRVCLSATVVQCCICVCCVWHLCGTMGIIVRCSTWLQADVYLCTHALRLPVWPL